MKVFFSVDTKVQIKIPFQAITEKAGNKGNNSNKNDKNYNHQMACIEKMVDVFFVLPRFNTFYSTHCNTTFGLILYTFAWKMAPSNLFLYFRVRFSFLFYVFFCSFEIVNFSFPPYTQEFHSDFSQPWLTRCHIITFSWL